MKTKLIALTILALIMGSGPAYAWDEDLHFNLMYYLARNVGFNYDDAVMIAGTAQYTDEHPNTEPVIWPTGVSAEQRRRFHFAKHDYVSAPDTTRNSFFGYFNMAKAIAAAKNSDTRAKSRYRFGISLHVLADTYSHESFGYAIGHMFAGHDPDRPYRQDNRDKIKQVSQLLYGWLIKYYTAYYNTAPSPTPFDQLEPNILDMIKYDGGQPSSYDTEIKNRAKQWSAQVETLGWGYALHDRSSYERSYKTGFEQAYKRYCVPHIPYAVSPDEIINHPMPYGEETGVLDEAEGALPFDQFCSYLNEQTGGELDRIVELLMTEAPYLIDAECTREKLNSVEALRKILAYLKEGADPYAVWQIIELARVSPEVKREFYLNHLDDPELGARLGAANQLYNFFDSDAAEQALKEMYLKAADDEARAAVLEWLPYERPFYAEFKDALTAEDRESRFIASQALSEMGGQIPQGALQRETRRLIMAGTIAKEAANAAILAFSYNPRNKASLNNANLNLLLTVIYKHGSRPYLKRAAVQALKSFYAPSGHKERGAIAKALVRSLKSKDYRTQWLSVSILQDVAGDEIALDPINPQGAVPSAEQWYSANFGESRKK